MVSNAFRPFCVLSARWAIHCVRLYPPAFFRVWVTVWVKPCNGADEAFADIADVWFPDGEKEGLSCIVILSDGQWGLGERTQAGEDFVTVDRGQLEQDPDDADQYYARSSAFDDVTYDMHTTAEKDLLWWGGENDTYLRQADSQ